LRLRRYWNVRLAMGPWSRRLESGIRQKKAILWAPF